MAGARSGRPPHVPPYEGGRADPHSVAVWSGHLVAVPSGRARSVLSGGSGAVLTGTAVPHAWGMSTVPC